MRQKSRLPKRKQPSNRPDKTHRLLPRWVRLTGRSRSSEMSCSRCASSEYAHNPLVASGRFIARLLGSPLMAGVTSLHTSAAMRGRRATFRWLTACLLVGTVSWLSVGRGSQKSDLVCAKPSALSEAENRQRRLDNYTEKSLEPSKTCSGCGFFTAAADPLACGKCQIFNGPANPQGKCDDWAARPV